MSDPAVGGPETAAERPVASIEQRNDQWLVIYASAVVGRFTAKYKAVEYAAHYNAAARDESLGVGHIWHNMACPAYSSLNPSDCNCGKE